MNFRRALYISFATHIIVFGVASVFSECGVHVHAKSLMVSLVGSEGSVSIPAHRKNEAVKKTVFPSQITDVSRGQMTNADPSSISDSLREKNIFPGAVQGHVKAHSGIRAANQSELLQAALDRVKQYPRIARERGIEGVTYVRFEVLPGGTIKHIEIIRSSGHDILDSASIKTINRLGSVPFVSGWVEVPIVYVLH
ncbi:MAG: energy transducer TonB [Nitrospirota bacterium]